MGRRDRALARHHQPRRRYPGTFRGDCGRIVQPSETPWHPWPDGFHRSRVPTRRAGTTITPAAMPPAACTKLERQEGSPSSAPGPLRVQFVPHLARYAKHLYVFQRTPSSVDARQQHPHRPRVGENAGARLARASGNATSTDMGVRRLPAPGRPDLRVRFLDRDRPQLGRRELGHHDHPESVTLEELNDLREQVDYRVMNGSASGSTTHATPGDGRGAEASIAESLQAAHVQRRLPADLQPAERHAGRCLGDAGGRDGSPGTGWWRTASNTRSTASSMRRASKSRRPCTAASASTSPAAPDCRYYDYYKDGFRTLHGHSSRNFPNWFYVGVGQNGLSVNMTAMFDAPGAPHRLHHRRSTRGWFHYRRARSVCARRLVPTHQGDDGVQHGIRNLLHTRLLQQ